MRRRASLVLESEFQKTVVEMAELLGWLVWHDNDSRRNKAGFLDLWMLRERLVIAELKKSDKDKPTPEQQVWINGLKAAGQEVYVWRPSDWNEIERVLKTRKDGKRDA